MPYTAAAKYHSFSNNSLLFFLFNHFPLLKVNFAAVFAELLPHSELAAAERCGVNLAQDLIDRYIVAG